MNKVCLACEFEHRTQDEDPCAACIEFEQFVPKIKQPSKTLLDEFAMAAMEGICANVPLEQFAQDVLDKRYDNDDQTDAYAYAAFEYARAMMKERARRDEMGNVKEVKENGKV